MGKDNLRHPRRLWLVIAALVMVSAMGCSGGPEDRDGARAATGGTSATATPTPGGSFGTPGGEALTGRALLEALRDGGYHVVFRHAATDHSTPDAGDVDLGDCGTQRNLSDAGRADAHAIGRAFRDLRIPVADVLTSPYCRTKETGRLAFGRVTATPELERLWPEDEPADRLAARRLEPLLRQAPASGRNNVLVVHGHYTRALDGIELAEGEAAVYRPGTGGPVRVARVLARAWTELA
ncbi:histidine phosphatase family protein [Nonomuraea sp. KM90]|uniref:histidine phosphatase family protein n=1 Tax=Nonomuraea sp. KM90 TaxID=3457428 RepID=UPI003FCC476D